MPKRSTPDAAVISLAVFLAAVAIVGIVLLGSGVNHDLGTSLIGFAVVTCWIPEAVRRRRAS